jgi:hypothetical protein
MMTKESLGPHYPLLKCNDCQEMVFTKSSNGPFYMDPEERIILREKDLVTAKFVMKNRKKLLKEIFSSNLLPNEDTSIKIGKKPVLINRFHQQIYEPGGSPISIQLLRKNFAVRMMCHGGRRFILIARKFGRIRRGCNF